MLRPTELHNDQARVYHTPVARAGIAILYNLDGVIPIGASGSSSALNKIKTQQPELEARPAYGFQ
jgi:hypothetical protein